MKHKEIIRMLKQISKKLDYGERHIKNDKWEELSALFKQVDEIQLQIKTSKPGVEALMKQNSGFKKEYEELKTALLQKTDSIIAAIEAWKVKHTEKISGSKEVLDNISKFYKESNTSYYIDRTE